MSRVPGGRSSDPLRGVGRGIDRGVDVEVEHHAALVVFGDVAVRHPDPGIGDVQQDVDGFSAAHEHGVLPDQVPFDGPSRLRIRNRPAPCTWNGWCIGWSESISLTSRIFTWSPTRNRQSIPVSYTHLTLPTKRIV